MTQRNGDEQSSAIKLLSVVEDSFVSITFAYLATLRWKITLTFEIDTAHSFVTAKISITQLNTKGTR